MSGRYILFISETIVFLTILGSEILLIDSIILIIAPLDSADKYTPTTFFQILKRDYDRADELDEEEKSLMMNLPIYTHSFTENSPQVPYHSQLLADFNTIIELADKFFEEFERNSFLNYIEEKPSFSKKIILNILSRIEKKTRKHIKKLTRQRVG